MFVEGLDVEPRPFVARAIQEHFHRILLQQGRQSLVDRQELVAFQVQQLETERQPGVHSSVRFSSVRDGIYALRKAHVRSTPSLRSFPNVPLETVP